MENNLVKIEPNKEKAKSILKMVETTLAMIKTVDDSKFSSNVVKEYYEVIRELSSIVLLLDGYKTYGEGSHRKLIEYIEKNYSELSEEEVRLIDDLRILRNKIAYDGFFVEKDYIKRKIDVIIKILDKLKDIINRKMI
jgi:hypothetical protein